MPLKWRSWPEPESWRGNLHKGTSCKVLKLLALLKGFTNCGLPRFRKSRCKIWLACLCSSNLKSISSGILSLASAIEIVGYFRRPSDSKWFRQDKNHSKRLSKNKSLFYFGSESASLRDSGSALIIVVLVSAALMVTYDDEIDIDSGSLDLVCKFYRNLVYTVAAAALAAAWAWIP